MKSTTLTSHNSQRLTKPSSPTQHPLLFLASRPFTLLRFTQVPSHCRAYMPAPVSVSLLFLPGRNGPSHCLSLIPFHLPQASSQAPCSLVEQDAPTTRCYRQPQLCDKAWRISCIAGEVTYYSCTAEWNQPPPRRTGALQMIVFSVSAWEHARHLNYSRSVASLLFAG